MAITQPIFGLEARNFACQFVWTIATYHIIQNQTKPKHIKPNQISLKWTNLVNCQTRSQKFCIVVRLDNTHISNHTKPNQTIPNQTKYHKNGYYSVNFQVKSQKFCMVVCLDNTHISYHTKPNQTIPYKTKPNITKTAITMSFFKLKARNFAWQHTYTIPTHHTI